MIIPQNRQSNYPPRITYLPASSHLRRLLALVACQFTPFPFSILALSNPISYPPIFVDLYSTFFSNSVAELENHTSGIYRPVNRRSQNSDDQPSTEEVFARTSDE